MKNILLFHAIPRRYYFRDILAAYQARDCRIGVVCDAAEIHNYRRQLEAGASHFLLPELSLGMDFEQNPAELRRLQELVRASERAAGMAQGRILLAGDRDWARGFGADCFHWFGTPLQRFALQSNRNPERLVLRAFAFLDKIFESFQPDLILGSSNCDPLLLSAWFLGRLRGVPFLSFRYSKVNSGRGYWSDDPIMENRLCRKLYAAKDAAVATPSESSRAQVLKFREKPRTVDYILKNWKKLAEEDFLRAHRDMWSLARDNLRYHRKGFRGRRPNPLSTKLAEVYRIALFSRLHARHYSSLSPEQLRETTYVYLPLHKEPELMLNYRSPLWHNQRHAIKYFSSMLPSGCTLVVREHRGNWGRRHGGWLRYVNSLPNVVLVEPFGSQFEYIRNAAVVLVDNGSTGWEGLLLDRPVISLADTFYDPVSLTRSIRNPLELDRAFMDALDSGPLFDAPERERRMALLIEADRETTMSAEDIQDRPEATLDYIERVLNS